MKPVISNIIAGISTVELIVPELGLVENEVSTEGLLPAHRGATISHEII
jgi:hypothetical protein